MCSACANECGMPDGNLSTILRCRTVGEVEGYPPYSACLHARNMFVYFCRRLQTSLVWATRACCRPTTPHVVVPAQTNIINRGFTLVDVFTRALNLAVHHPAGAGAAAFAVSSNPSAYRRWPALAYHSECVQWTSRRTENASSRVAIVSLSSGRCRMALTRLEKERWVKVVTAVVLARPVRMDTSSVPILLVYAVCFVVVCMFR